MTDTPIRTAQEMAEDAIEALLRNAYRQGAEDVHHEWSEYEGDFGEAADDYAKSVDIEAVLTDLSDRIQPTTLPDREAIVRVLAGHFGPGFDNCHRDKTHWRETGGVLNGVYTDVNDPRQDDFLNAADAILALMKGEG